MNKELVRMVEGRLTADSAEVQQVIRRHFAWVKQFWTPTQASYRGLGRLYAEYPDFRKFYEAYHPQLAEFLAEAMRVFAERELA